MLCQKPCLNNAGTLHDINLLNIAYHIICKTLQKLKMIFYEKVSVSFLEEGIELIFLTIRALLKPLVPTGLVSLPIDSLRHHVTCFVTKWLVKQISLGPFITEHLRQLFSANINFALTDLFLGFPIYHWWSTSIILKINQCERSLEGSFS